MRPVSAGGREDNRAIVLGCSQRHDWRYMPTEYQRWSVEILAVPHAHRSVFPAGCQEERVAHADRGEGEDAAEVTTELKGGCLEIG